MHVTFDVVFDESGNGHAYLSFNGVEVLHEDNLVGAPPITGQHTVLAEVFSWASYGNTPPLVVTADNVVMRVE